MKKFFGSDLTVSFALVGLSTTTMSCGNNSETVTPSPNNIVKVASETTQLSNLTSLLKLCELDKTLATETKKTVFAPNNDAFTKVFGKSFPTTCTDSLKSILSYHVVSGTVVQGSSITSAEAKVDTLAGSIFAKVKDSKIIINNSSTVVKGDVTASDGVVHIVDTVLIPDSAGTVVQIAAKRDDFSALVSLLKLCNLNDTLSAESGTLTVFAPTNAAFTKYLNGAAGPTTCSTDLKNTLVYHVLGAKVKSTDLKASQASTSLLASNNLFITKTDAAGVVINGGSKVVAADLESAKGVVHVVDTVLVPDALGTIVAALSKRFDHTALVSSVVNANLTETLSGTGPFTVFAPTNAAFEAIASTTATLSVAQLTKVLTHHVLSSKKISSEIPSGQTDIATVESSTIRLNKSDAGLYVRGSDLTQLGSVDAQAPKVTEADIVTSNGVIHVISRVLIPTAL
jgi:transforming growth factor-beta-induced protein